MKKSFYALATVKLFTVCSTITSIMHQSTPAAPSHLFLPSYLQFYAKGYLIDNYAKDGGPGESDFCVAFTMSLCALELKRTLISLLFQIIRL